MTVHNRATNSDDAVISETATNKSGGWYRVDLPNAGGDVPSPHEQAASLPRPTATPIDPTAIWGADPVIASSFASEPITAAEQAGPHGSIPDSESSNSTTEQVTQHDAATQPPAAELAPAWEVDEFNWPREADKLLSQEATYFGHAGEKLVAASEQGLRVLGVASARAGEGSTTTAVCLARAAAQAGARVALFDGNTTHPELGDRLGLDFAAGWQDAASGEVPIKEAAVKAINDQITLFPLAKNAQDVLVDQDLQPLVRGIASHFDLVVIDAGNAADIKNCVLGGSSNLLDAAIVVRDVRYTSEAEASAFAAHLKDAGVKAVGIAENFTQPQANAAAA